MLKIGVQPAEGVKIFKWLLFTFLFSCSCDVVSIHMYSLHFKIKFVVYVSDTVILSQTCILFIYLG
jgi:hypothetical protein